MQLDGEESIIEVRDISFSYDGAEDVLTDVTLAIHRGDYVGFVGPNGAGKTTLLKVMLNLLTPDAGTVRLFGQDIRDFKDWHRMGYVPQKTAHFEANFPASAYEVVSMARYSRRTALQRASRADKESVKDALLKLDMWEQRNRLIGDLSGGEQQRVFIARALVNQPEVIFLDEPTTGVDRKTQDGFYGLLQRLNKEMGLTLVLVSHDIERIAQEVMLIACVDRKLTCHLSPEEYLAESGSSNIGGKNVTIISHHHHN